MKTVYLVVVFFLKGNERGKSFTWKPWDFTLSAEDSTNLQSNEFNPLLYHTHTSWVLLCNIAMTHIDITSRMYTPGGMIKMKMRRNVQTLIKLLVHIMWGSLLLTHAISTSSVFLHDSLSFNCYLSTGDFLS